MAKKKMDKAMREKLAGILPMSSTAKYDFVPDIFKDIPEEFQPVFTIRSLTKSEVGTVKTIMAGAFDSMSDTKKKLSGKIAQGVKRQEELTEVAKNIILGWTNLVNFDNGEELVFAKDHIDFFPENLTGAIMNKATEITGFIPKTED